jgi:uncharacterized membrane protein
MIDHRDDALRAVNDALPPLLIATHLALLASTLALLAAPMLDITGASRALLAVTLFLVTPGYALATEVLRRRGYELLIMTVVLSITVSILVATLQVWAGWFHPGVHVAVVGGACAFLLGRGLGRRVFRR